MGKFKVGDEVVIIPNTFLNQSKPIKGKIHREFHFLNEVCYTVVFEKGILDVSEGELIHKNIYTSMLYRELYE